jgi:uncharacterized protein (TIGR03083 family)
VVAAPLWPLHGANLGTLLRTCDAVGACLAVPRLPWVPDALARGNTLRHRSCVHFTGDPLRWLEKERGLGSHVLGVELADEAVRLADLPVARGGGFAGVVPAGRAAVRHDGGVDALAGLRVVSGAFEDGVGLADPAAATAATRWTVAQLVAHLGEVHRWAANNARGGPRAGRRNVPEVGVPLVQWYRESRAILLDAMDELDPEQGCWTLSPADRSVRFWHRRQLHEVVVHLWDLRSAADPGAAPPAEVGPEVYADGVDELFEVFRPRGECRPLSEPIALRATDCAREWVVGRDWELGGSADVEVAAPVGELMLFLWNRVTPAGAAGLSPALLREFRGARIRP